MVYFFEDWKREGENRADSLHRPSGLRSGVVGTLFTLLESVSRTGRGSALFASKPVILQQREPDFFLVKKAEYQENAI